MTERYLIAGLGNPGKKYEQTRHNIGFWIVNELARRYGLDFGKQERKAVTADGMIRNRRVLLVQPQTFMNKSGEAVRALMDFYKIEQERILVIYDELDLPLGTLRLRKSGSAGGHNGIRSIINHLGNQDFNRLRCGIDRPPGRMAAAAYVLQAFSGDDAITAQLMTERAADAVETWLADGIELAMSRHNGNIDGKKPEP